MGDCLLRKCVVRGEKHGTSMFSRSDHLSYLFTRWLNLVGIYIMYINLEINKQIIERRAWKFRLPNRGPQTISLLPFTWAFQCDEPHSYTSKAISSLRRSGEKHAFESTLNYGAPVAGETLIKNSPPWPNIKSQVRGIQVGTVIEILKTCNICLN